MAKENGSKAYLYCICGVAVIGGLLFGYDTAVISGAEEALQQYFILGLGKYYEDGIFGMMHGVVVSTALIGCIIGGFISGTMANHLGRRNSLIVSSVLFFLSALGSYMPEFLFRSDFSFYKPGEATKGVLLAFVLYRILGGIGVGMASAICPMYIAEVAPAHMRGNLVSCNQFAIIFGQLVVYAVNAVIRSLLASNEDARKVEMVRIGWRVMFVSECVPAALFGILLFLVPKTPRFLVMKNNDEKATKVLTRINGEKNAQLILQDIKDTLHEKKESVFTYGVLVVIVGVLLSVFQQFVGINVVLYYAVRIFKNMGYGDNAAMYQTVVMGFVNIVFTVLAIFTVDKWGRRPLLIVGSTGMFIGMFGLSILSFMDRIGIFALVLIIVYTASFMMSWGPVCWVLISEIFPNTIRGTAVAIAVAAQWASNFLISISFLKLKEWSVGGTYLIYATFCALSAIFVWKLVPETKGKTLEDMNELWSKGKKKNDLPY